MAQEDDEKSPAPMGLGDPTRLLALSDGVFAIIMTLLVLDLQVPLLLTEDKLYEVLLDRIPTFVAYVFGFLLAGVYWIGHRDLFNRVKVVTYPVLWFNVVFLMIASLIPFGAKLLGNYPESPTVLALYGSLLALLAGCRLAFYRFVTGHIELLIAPVPPLLRRRVTQVMIFATSAFTFCVIFGRLIPANLVLSIYGFTPVIFVSTITYVSRGWLPPEHRHHRHRHPHHDPGHAAQPPANREPVG
jgi:uncharacterized membrane protein